MHTHEDDIKGEGLAIWGYNSVFLGLSQTCLFFFFYFVLFLLLFDFLLLICLMSV